MHGGTIAHASAIHVMLHIVALYMCYCFYTQQSAWYTISEACSVCAQVPGGSSFIMNNGSFVGIIVQFWSNFEVF